MPLPTNVSPVELERASLVALAAKVCKLVPRIRAVPEPVREKSVAARVWSWPPPAPVRVMVEPPAPMARVSMVSVALPEEPRPVKTRVPPLIVRVALLLMRSTMELLLSRLRVVPLPTVTPEEPLMEPDPLIVTVPWLTVVVPV